MPLKNKLKYIFTIFFLQFFVFINFTIAQNASLSGKIIDANTNKGLKLATVTIVNSKDSTLITFAKTNEQGEYIIKNIPFKSTLVIYSYPGYANYSDSLVFTSSEEIKIKDITITTKAKLLEDVIVKQKISAIRFKGDTMEMIADSFKTGANANVQELLRKMPGITINSKGEITAQGEKVDKVFVDGEEFFSDDPAVVTQNLRADGIDKVQVYDKKSDNATFTGIDDGEKSKVINLKLKENAKKGYFGKLDAGTDFNKYKSGKAMVNLFRGKSKFATYITTDNTRLDGLDWSDRTNYGEDLNRNSQVNDDGGVSMWSNGDDFNWSDGLPNSTTGGLHYSKKSNEDKINNINTYQFNNLSLNGFTTNKQQSILSDSSSIFSNNSRNFNSEKTRNRLRTTFDWKIDSTSEFKFITTGTILNNKTNSTLIEQNIDQKNLVLNDVVRKTNSNTNTETLLTNISYRKRLKKKGRTISSNIDLNFNSGNGESMLNADNKFYTSGLVNQIVDQEKISNDKALGINGRISYTEPLSKKMFLETNVKININNNNSLKNTLEQTIVGTKIYDKKIDSLSNHFKYNNAGYSGGVSLKYVGKKINFNVGSNYGTVSYELSDIVRNRNREISFNNFNPSASFNYTPKKQIRYNIGYYRTNTNPTLQQINPIIDNIDPLNIMIGNENLNQELRHNINISMSKYKVFKEKNIYISINGGFVENAITYANKIDKLSGAKVTQAINVNGNYNFSMWSSYGFKATKNLSLDFNFSPSIRRTINIVNSNKNINDNTSFNFSVGSSKWNDGWLNYWFQIGTTYNLLKSTLNPSVTKYFNYYTNSSFELKLKKKWYLDIDHEIKVFQKTQQFANTPSLFILNAGVKKSISKNENWQLVLRANDIFNNNQMIDRNISSNFIKETTKQTIRRFIMLRLVYNFSKNGKPSQGW